MSSGPRRQRRRRKPARPFASGRSCRLVTGGSSAFSGPRGWPSWLPGPARLAASRPPFPRRSVRARAHQVPGTGPRSAEAHVGSGRRASSSTCRFPAFTPVSRPRRRHNRTSRARTRPPASQSLRLLFVPKDQEHNQKEPFKHSATGKHGEQARSMTSRLTSRSLQNRYTHLILFLMYAS